ncbi:hypothetical protein OG338_22060 [Streptomyces sp. NBC_00726]|uniref:hypothetical protein n=1 Tax=Streptomyces sp. NBC_00726 TaxID=2903674 RepID=UPI003864AD07
MPNDDRLFPGASPVDSYGTGFTSTAVYRLPAGGGFRWVRSAGPQRSEPVRPPPAVVLGRIRALPAEGMDFALPEARGHRLVHAANGPESLANILMTQSREYSYPRACDLLGRLGKNLGELHSISGRDMQGKGHLGISRLSGWLGDGSGAGESGRLFTAARKRLGSARWDLLRDWCDACAEPSPDDVLLHGKPGTGLVVPGLNGSRAALLTGEDMAVGRPSLDVGWVLGELAELRGVIRDQAGDAAAAEWSTLGSAFAGGYGRAPTAETGRVATLCVLNHVRDYCAHVEWSEWWVPTVLNFVADECDRGGSGTLAWGEAGGG